MLFVRNMIFFSICIPYNDSSFLLQPHCGKIAIFDFENPLIFAPKLYQKIWFKIRKILIFVSKICVGAERPNLIDYTV